MTNCGGKLPRAGRRAREGDMAEPWLRSSRHQTGSVVSSRKGIGLVGGKATWMDGWMDRKEGSAEGGGRSDGQKWMQMSCVRGCIDYLQATKSFRRGIETPFAARTARPPLWSFGFVSDELMEPSINSFTHSLFLKGSWWLCFQERERRGHPGEERAMGE